MILTSESTMAEVLGTSLLLYSILASIVLAGYHLIYAYVKIYYSGKEEYEGEKLTFFVLIKKGFLYPTVLFLYTSAVIGIALQLTVELFRYKL